MTVVAWLIGSAASTWATADPPDGAYPLAQRGATEQVEPIPAPPPVPTFPVPADSGSGRRVVYSKIEMRVWAIEADGTVAHTHRVSGKTSAPLPGTYAVFSKSTHTCANHNPAICMRFMVRFAHSFRGDNIGFHEIPERGGVPLQTVDQLGQALSGGCVRQSTDDAIWMWNWADIGTSVTVIG